MQSCLDVSAMSGGFYKHKSQLLAYVYVGEYVDQVSYYHISGIILLY